jgi:PAS domain S-box-containing protein
VGFHQDGPFWIADIGVRIPGFWFLVHIFYSTIIVTISLLLFLHVAWRKEGVFRKQALLVAGSGLVGLIGSTIPSFNLALRSEFSPFVPAIGLSILPIFWAILRFEFLKAEPKISDEAGTRDLGPLEKRSLALFMLIYVVLASSLTAVGFISYYNYERHFRSQVEAQLSAIAELKVSELQNWRNERMEDALLLYRNPAFSSLVQRFLEDPDDPLARAELLTWLERIQSYKEYDRVSLLDPFGRERLASPSNAGPLDTHMVEDVANTLKTGKVTFLDFHREKVGPIHLTILVPLFADDDLSHPLGVLLIRIDPAVYLYPFIQNWPAPSATAETLIVRRDGDDLVFLNPLRFMPDAALNLRLPITEGELPAARAVLGFEGVMAGRDYRDIPVIAATRAIPGSPWFLVARMDTVEVYAPLRERLWQMVAFFGALILLAGTALTLVWRQQRMRFYRSQLETVEALRMSEEKFSKAFLTTPDPISITRLSDGKFVTVNQGFENVMGYQAGEVIGKTAIELGIWENPKERERLVAALQADGMIKNFESTFRAKDGARRYALMAGSTIELNGEKHFLNTTHDITDRKRTEMIIRALLGLVEFASGHSLRELLVRTLDEVCAITESPIGFYHFADPDTETLTLQAWSTRTVREFCTAEGLGQHYPISQAGVWVDCVHEKKPVIHNDYASLPHRKGLPNGHAPIVRELVVPILRAGQVVAILGVGNKSTDYNDSDVETVSYFADVAWEIAERKRAEDANKAYSDRLQEMVNERTRELGEAQEKLLRQERLAVLGQLAGSVGHELRNPLGVISNAVFFLNLIQPDPEIKVREYLEIIANETRTAEKIITDLLDFSRVKFVDREPVSVMELVERTLGRFPIPQNVQLSLDIPKDLPQLNVDLHQLIQVLGNLTTNACQAMPDGGDLTISARLVNDMVALSVTDTGMGIGPENMKRLFEPLFTTKTRGIGLGLAVSRKLTEANGGRIEVRSEAGRGSTFTVYLPLSESEKWTKSAAS